MSTEAERFHDFATWLAEEAYAAGVLDERARVAGAVAELGEAWHANGARAHTAGVTSRLAELGRCAEKLALHLAERYGRPPWLYEGGPVDWDTGRPLRGAR